VLAEPQRHLVAVQFGGQPLGRQSGTEVGQPPRVERTERFAPPLAKRGLVCLERPAIVRLSPRPRQAVPEPVQIDRLGIRLYYIAAMPALDPNLVRRRQAAAQPRQVAVQHVPVTRPRVISPDPIHQLIHRHDAARIDQESDQHAPLPGMADVNSPPIDPDLDVTKKPELRRHPNPPTLAPHRIKTRNTMAARTL
jgi:hypothetical protein